MFRFKKRNMAAVLPKLTQQEREFLCKGLGVSLAQLSLTDREKVIKYVTKYWPRTELHNKLEPLWLRALSAWLVFTIAATRLTGVIAVGAGIFWLALTQSPYFGALLIPYITFCTVGWLVYISDI